MSETALDRPDVIAPDSGPEHPVAFRGGGFAAGEAPTNKFASWLVLGGLIAFWQFAASTGLVSPTFLPGPLRIVTALYELARAGTLWHDISASLTRVALGWSIGASIGLAVGTMMALFSLARSIGRPIISALFPIPKLAILPLFVLWMGIGETPKVVTIALGVFFPVAIATYSGIDSVPPNLIRMAQSFNVPVHQIIWKVLLPGAMPSILAGIRISASLSLLLLVAAEMVGAEHGLGQFVMLAGSLMRSDHLLAGVVVLSTLGLIIGVGLTMLEKRLFKWR